jgi:ubiquinone/menaquinone biosynthesis C-methylase UbiE
MTTIDKTEACDEQLPGRSPEQGQQQESIANYYDDTLIDYEAWSKEGYLHFGYWRPWLNPFSRRPMLEEMNRFVLQYLQVSDLAEGKIADLGCGFGAVSRFGSRLYPKLEFHAMTLSPGQAVEGRRRNSDERVSYYCGDYHEIPLETASVAGVFYMESLCHSTTPDRALAEAARVLQPGRRIVLTDGFLTKPLEKTSPAFRHVVHAVADNWAVPMFHEIERARLWTGGGALRLVEDIECGWRVGPSALHAAHLSLMHWFKLLLSRNVTVWQRRHLTASAYTIALGLYRRYFRYHLLVFERQ